MVNILRSDVDLMVNRRVLIVMDEGAEAKLLFCDDSADDRNFLGTQVIEAYVGENASLDLYCLEETHDKNTRVSNVYIEQQANSRVNHNVITLRNGITRNRLDLVFKGEGAECWCNGCVIADKSQHVDNNTLIDHQVGHCDSHELYKYVVDDDAIGAFAGRVLVRHDSQKTTSDERNQNLVMKFLAAMTIILAIPTVVSSFFGMNVPVPFADNAHGFLYVICIALSISIVSAYVLWHRDMF